VHAQTLPIIGIQLVLSLRFFFYFGLASKMYRLNVYFLFFEVFSCTCVLNYETKKKICCISKILYKFLNNKHSLIILHQFKRFFTFHLLYNRMENKKVKIE
jgi:hypothetical protein